FSKARYVNPSARICAYGLYAPLNASWLRSLGVDNVLGGEFEEELTAIARDLAAGPAPAARARSRGPGAVSTVGPREHRQELRAAPQTLPRLHFLVPDRSGLPPLDRYA